MASNPSGIILLLTVISLIAFIVPSEAQEKYQVGLFNGSENQTLSVNCNVTAQNKPPFSLKPLEGDQIIIPLPGVATCAMTMGKLHGVFVVFDSKRDAERCPADTCYWIIGEEGLLLLLDNVGFALQFQWPSS